MDGMYPINQQTHAVLKNIKRNQHKKQHTYVQVSMYLVCVSVSVKTSTLSHVRPSRCFSSGTFESVHFITYVRIITSIVYFITYVWINAFPHVRLDESFSSRTSGSMHFLTYVWINTFPDVLDEYRSLYPSSENFFLQYTLRE